MPSPDDPRSRRALALLSHGKPKPYRRHSYSEEGPRLSRLQLGLLIAAAVLVAALILAVAVVMQEHENATRGKQIVAAGTVPAAPPPSARIAPTAIVTAPLPLTPPALDDSSLPLHDPQSPPPARMDRALHLPAPPPLQVKRKLPRPAAVDNKAAADPDVDLIATILSLTPPPAPQQADQPCALTQPALPACLKAQGAGP